MPSAGLAIYHYMVQKTAKSTLWKNRLFGELPRRQVSNPLGCCRTHLGLFPLALDPLRVYG